MGDGKSVKIFRELWSQGSPTVDCQALLLPCTRGRSGPGLGFRRPEGPAVVAMRAGRQELLRALQAHEDRPCRKIHTFRGSRAFPGRECLYHRQGGTWRGSDPGRAHLDIQSVLGSSGK